LRGQSRLLAIAFYVQMSRQLLHGILREEKPISAESAVKIGKYVGNGAGLWLRMQTSYDLYIAEQEMRHIVKQIPATIYAAA
jgi:addiction module HigA family antidote